MNRLACMMSIVLGLAGVGCVSQVEVAGAPCPCPDGYACCESLMACLSPQETCPESYPPSSGDPCSENADCPNGEICQAWRNAQGNLAGPGECRHDCTGRKRPCADLEACEPVPEDGRSLSEMRIGWACVPEVPISGCEGRECRQCKQVGATFCNDEQTVVLGCFLAVHPECGLACSLIEVEACDGLDSECEPLESGARCTFPEYDGDICGLYPCEACPSVPGSLYCRDDDLWTCATVSVLPEMCPTGCACTEVCLPTLSQECPGRCSMDDGAHCLP